MENKDSLRRRNLQIAGRQYLVFRYLVFGLSGSSNPFGPGLGVMAAKYRLRLHAITAIPAIKKASFTRPLFG
jgi:hypothetical protein